MCYTRQTVKKGKSQKKEVIMMNELIKRIEKQINKLRSSISVETANGLRVDDKYSDFVIFMLNELKSYLDTLKIFQKTGLTAGIYVYNTEFFKEMNDYIRAKEFSPLTKTLEFKGLFETFRRPNTVDMVADFIEENMDKILKFSALSNKVISTNEVFSDEKLYNYRRGCKVATKLDSLNSQDMPSKTLVEIYANGGFDNLCPKALEDKRRCDELRLNAIKMPKRKLGLGRIFHGLF